MASHRIPTSRLLLTALAGLALSLLPGSSDRWDAQDTAEAGEARAAQEARETPAASGDTEVPVLGAVSDEVWANFRRVFAASPWGRAAYGLTWEKCASIESALKLELGIPMDFHYRDVVKEIIEEEPGFDDGEVSYALAITNLVEESDAYQNGRISAEYGLVLYRDGDPLGRVLKQHLDEIRFSYLKYVSLQHPLQRKLANFAVNSEALTTTATRLCELANVEHVITGRGSATDELLTLQLRGRSIMECLELAADCAGWKVQLHVENADGLGSPITTHWEEVSETYGLRSLLNMSESSDKPIETWGDALAYTVREEASRITRMKPVVIVKP